MDRGSREQRGCGSGSTLVGLGISVSSEPSDATTEGFLYLPNMVRTVNVELQHVVLDAFVEIFDSFGKSAAEVSKPGHVFLLQVSHTPDVSSLDQSQQVKASNRRAIPIEIR